MLFVRTAPRRLKEDVSDVIVLGVKGRAGLIRGLLQ